MKAIVTHLSESNKSVQKYGMMDLKKLPEIGDYLYIDEDDNDELYWVLCDCMEETDDGLVSPHWRIEDYDEYKMEGECGYLIRVINENEI